MRLLRAIKEAQAVGFTLTEIGEYLRASRRSTSPSEILRVRMAAKIDEIDGRIAGLRRMRDELARVVGCACDSLDHCTCGAAYLARSGGEAAAPADGPPRDERGERRQHAPPHRARRRRPVRGRTCSMRGRCPPSLDRSSSVAVPRFCRTAAGVAGGRSSRRSSVATLSSSAHSPSECPSSSGSSTTCTTSCSSSTCSRSPARRVRHRARFSSTAFPGRPAFRGLGELTAEELETPLARAAGAHAEDALETAAAVWDAFRAPEPGGLAEWLGRGTPTLPLLAPALRRLLEELPASRRRALHDGADRPARPGRGRPDSRRRVPRRPGARAGAVSRRHLVLPRAARTSAAGAVDSSRPGTARSCRLPPPLGDGRLFAGSPVRLTRDGERALAGEADRVELLGVDRWVGGTHISTDAVWRWDAASQRLVAP